MNKIQMSQRVTVNFFFFVQTEGTWYATRRPCKLSFSMFKCISANACNCTNSKSKTKK